MVWSIRDIVIGLVLSVAAVVVLQIAIIGPALAAGYDSKDFDGAIAAVCGDIGLPPETADALLLISRVPGLAAHALEEQGRERPMRAIDPAKHHYDGPSERRLTHRRK